MEVISLWTKIFVFSDRIFYNVQENTLNIREQTVQHSYCFVAPFVKVWSVHTVCIQKSEQVCIYCGEVGYLWVTLSKPVLFNKRFSNNIQFWTDIRKMQYYHVRSKLRTEFPLFISISWVGHSRIQQAVNCVSAVSWEHVFQIRYIKKQNTISLLLYQVFCAVYW